MTNQDNALNRVKRSLINIESTDPFFASVALNLKLVEDSTITTACTDGKFLRFNPDYIMDKSRDYLDNIIVHEIVHVILKHPILLGKFSDKKRARIAMELSVNSLIYTRNGFPEDVLLPGRGSYVNMPMGKNTEIYYDKLKKNDNRSKRDNADSSDDDNADEEAESDNGADRSKEEADRSNVHPEGSPSNAEDNTQDSGSDGSNAGGKNDGSGSKKGKLRKVRPTDKSEDNAEGGSQTASSAKSGRNEDTENSTVRRCKVSEGLGEVETYKYDEGESPEEVERKWEEIISQAANDAASAGNMPGEFEELVTKLLGVTGLPWYVILRQWLIRNIRRGRSFRRPNRRTLYRQDIVPSRMTKGLGKLVLGVDVSGSMDQEEMNKALATCIDIGKVYPDFELGIIQFDTDITKQDWFTRFNANKDYFKNWSWKGRGGTSYVAFFKQIKSFNADIVVLVTDGYPNDGWPDMRLIRIPVMWLITKEADIPENVKKHRRVIPLNNT